MGRKLLFFLQCRRFQITLFSFCALDIVDLYYIIFCRIWIISRFLQIGALNSLFVKSVILWMHEHLYLFLILLFLQLLHNFSAIILVTIFKIPFFNAIHVSSGSLKKGIYWISSTCIYTLLLMLNLKKKSLAYHPFLPVNFDKNEN